MFKALPRWLASKIPDSIYNWIMAPTKESAKDVIGRFVKDPKLRALLEGGQLIDWNLQPDK